MSRSANAAAAAASNPKAAHYIGNLGAALVRGAWTDPNPGAAPNGAQLSWSELIRKWGKHTGGFIGALRNISLLETQASTHVSSDPGVTAAVSGSSHHHSLFHLPHRQGHGHVNGSVGPNAVSTTDGTVATTSASAIADAAASAGPDVDGWDGAEPGAWAQSPRIGRQLTPEAAQGVRDACRELDSVLSSSSLHPNERASALLTRAYGLFASGDFQGALGTYETFDWSNPAAGVVDGDAAVVERIRARTCQGIIYEVGPQPDPQRALQCYVASVDLLNQLSVSPLVTPSYLLPPNATRASPPSAESQREALRFVSTALCRSAVLCAHGNNVTTLLRILRTYHALSSNWAHRFRSRQRQSMLHLYLSALYSSYPASGAVVTEPLLTTGGVHGQTARAMWRAEVAEAFVAGRRLLSDTTHFPRAGAMNMPVVEFAAQVAAFPDRLYAVTRDTISVLWWATTLTFQSQAILRHLTKQLASAGDVTEARRVFELYVGVVLKARETENPDHPLELRRRPEDVDDSSDLIGNANDHQPMPNGANGNGNGNGAANGGEQVIDPAELDSDEDLVSTLLIGIRLLVSELDDAPEAWRYALLAGDVVKRGRVTRAAESQVWAAKGAVRLAMTATVVDRTTRPKYQAQAINCLKHAAELDPTSATTFYQLAYAEASARSIDPAINSIRAALDIDPNSVRAWHLLALLLTASGEWQSASTAAETGVSLWEDADTTLAAEEADLPTPGAVVLASPGPLITPAGQPYPPEPAPRLPPRRSERLQEVMQLRMTLNVITEKLRGPDIALTRQQELFSFFSKRTERERSEALSRAGTLSGTSVGVPSGPGSTHADPPTTAIHPASPQLAPSVLDEPIASDVESRGPQTLAAPATAPLSRKKSLLPKHLHVPSVGARAHSRSASAPTRSGPAGAPVDDPRARQPSTPVSIARSIAPSAVHSHYFAGRSRTLSAPPPPVRSGPRRSPAEERLLSDLWLQSAASFRRAGKLEQSLVSIEEAETHDAENPAVWVQLGQWHLAARAAGIQSDPGDALAAFTKSLLLSPDYPAGVVSMARLRMQSGDTDLAHSLLTQLTLDKGWDVAEAWYALAGVCGAQGNAAKARECLLFALELERTRACRPVGAALRVGGGSAVYL